ncbi:glutamyl-tRNA reductase [Planctomycetales bacterium]|nr:glutamyl-tRNA reductase [Planctomycetales bacterium]
MNIRCIGIDHQSSSLAIRELLAFSPPQVSDTLALWLEQQPDTEAVLLSTCNRTEFYYASESNAVPETETVIKFLLSQKQCPEQGFTLASHIFSYTGLEAVKHLFSVSAGLDSMVLGEVQILSQVKAAYQTASETGTVGTVLHILFQAALNTAKQIAAQTELHRHRISIPSVAISDFALQIFENLKEKKIVVFGAGEMGQETVRYLIENGVKHLTVLNRNPQRALQLAAQFKGNAADWTLADWENRLDEIVDADMLISTTGASEPVLTFADYRKIEPLRNGKTLFILDLAVPRDIEKEIADCSNVYLYSLDDLQEVCRRNRSQRDKEIPKAIQIAERSAEELVQRLNHRNNGKIIGQLQEKLSQIKEQELERLFNKLPELDEKEQNEIRYAFQRLTGKFLHQPLETLRDASKEETPFKLLDALASLFRL